MFSSSSFSLSLFFVLFILKLSLSSFLENLTFWMLFFKYARHWINILCNIYGIIFLIIVVKSVPLRERFFFFTMFNSCTQLFEYWVNFEWFFYFWHFFARKSNIFNVDMITWFLANPFNSIYDYYSICRAKSSVRKVPSRMVRSVIQVGHSDSRMPSLT